MASFGAYAVANVMLFTFGITIAVERDQTTVTLNTQVRERSTTTFDVTRAPSPTPKQAKIWRGLSSGSMGN